MTEAFEADSLPRPLVSVVVAVYNVVDYVEDCILSLLAQTYLSLEIVLVDDGSTDGSGELCDRYAAGEERVRVIHKINGGLSDARNRGTEESSGEFVVYVDGDDVVAPCYVEALARPLIEGKAELSACALAVVPNADFYFAHNSATCHGTPSFTLYSSYEALRRVLLGGSLDVSACGKLARKDQWLAHPFPAGRVYEDLATVPGLIGDVCKVALTEEGLYGQIIRQGSITRTTIIDSCQFEDYWQAICSAEASCGLVGDEGVRQALEVRRLVTYSRMKHIYQSVSAKNDEVREIYLELDDRLRREARSVLRVSGTSFKTKTNVLLAAYAPAIHALAFGFLQFLKGARR